MELNLCSNHQVEDCFECLVRSEHKHLRDKLTAMEKEWEGLFEEHEQSRERYHSTLESLEATQDKLAAAEKDVAVQKNITRNTCDRVMEVEAENARLREAATEALKCIGEWEIYAGNIQELEALLRAALKE